MFARSLRSDGELSGLRRRARAAGCPAWQRRRRRRAGSAVRAVRAAAGSVPSRGAGGPRRGGYCTCHYDFVHSSVEITFFADVKLWIIFFNLADKLIECNWGVATGRVVITDHGGFVVVNVYGPAISSPESAEERLAFKLRFYQVSPRVAVI